MNPLLIRTFATVLTLSTSAFAQDLSYDDLLNELNYKRARLARLNDGGSISQKSISFGAVTSLNQIESPTSIKYPWLQGFEFGLNSDLGSQDIEGRTLFRYFFENQKSQERTSLREITFLVTKSQEYDRSWDWTYGGGFSLRHLLHDSPFGNINEVSIQLNGMLGFETKISSTSRIAFEAGTRFPFGISGRDRFSLDTGIKLKTDLE
jgi:hypothetical protein